MGFFSATKFGRVVGEGVGGGGGGMNTLCIMIQLTPHWHLLCRAGYRERQGMPPPAYCYLHCLPSWSCVHVREGGGGGGRKDTEDTSIISIIYFSNPKI